MSIRTHYLVDALLRVEMGNPVKWRRSMRQGCIVLLILVLLVTCIFAGCGGVEGLPDYVSRVSGDSMQIDVAKATH